MAFSRRLQRPKRMDPDELTGCLAGIGMNLAAAPRPDANLEDSILAASELGMVQGDLRVLGLLCLWLELHHSCLNADRLVKLVWAHDSERLRCFWAAVVAFLPKDRRLARLQKAYLGKRLDLLPVGTEFQVARRGEDSRFAGSCLRVPAGALRTRQADVLGRPELLRLHPGYRNRVRFGPNWRADLWTILERNPELSVSEAARAAYCSFATAWQVAQDFRLLEGQKGALGGTKKRRSLQRT